MVVYDACVLHPAPLRDFLVRLAVKGPFRARWTEKILDECFASVLRRRPDLKPESLARTRTLMTVPDCLVDDYESRVAGIDLPDADDRHVLAAAIRTGAQVIVTANLDDFPAGKLAAYDLEAQHPDEFVLHIVDLAPGVVVGVLREQAAALRSPPRSASELLDILEAQGLVQSAAALRGLLDGG